MAILWVFLSLTLVIKQCTKRPQLWGSRCPCCSSLPEAELGDCQHCGEMSQTKLKIPQHPLRMTSSASLAPPSLYQEA